MKIAYDADCLDPTSFGAYGYGGFQRTQQILELLESGGLEVLPVERKGIFFSRKQRLKACIKVRRLTRTFSFRKLQRIAHDYLVYRHALAGEVGLLLLEGAASRIPFFAAAHSGKRFYCLPQCCAALWPGYIDPLSGARAEQALREHRKAYELADGIGWISREEQWLAANLGLVGDWIPYFPYATRHAELVSIRTQRQNRQPNADYLIIATEYNSDDVDVSFVQQAQWLMKVLPKGKSKVHVVGYASDKYRHVWNDDIFVVHGTVAPEKLNDLMATCRALFSHGTRGLGLITRVVDSLVAGLPVIANRIASRSLQEMEGLQVYDDVQDLKAICASEIPAVSGAVPTVLKGKAEKLVPILRALSGAEGPDESRRK